jgi:hypothetical protein
MADQIIVGVILVIISAFLGIIGFLVVRTLTLIDRNQIELFGRIQKVEAALVHISAKLNIDNNLDL